MRGLLAWTLFGSALVAMSSARAHDLWLEPSTYFAARGQEVNVTLPVGEHGAPEEVKPWRRADIVHFSLFSARRPPVDLSGKLPREPETPAPVPVGFRAEGGSALLALERAPKRLDQDGEHFTAYLTEEGQTEALARRAAAGQTGQPGHERYHRYLKALVQDPEATAISPALLYRRRVGQRLEILLENNPGRLRPGQPVRVRVLFERQPLPGARVTALHRPRPDAPADRTLTATTDAAGRASFPPFDVGGPWLVRLVHLRPAPTPTALPPAPGSVEEAAWESFWASYTFGVRLLPPQPPASASPAPPRRRD